MNNKEATELVRRFPEVFATLREYIEKLERENAELQRKLIALKINYAQDKENYQCAARAGMAVEKKLKRENEALRTALKTALAIESLDESNLDELIARCRSVIREQKIKQMTDAASLDIGHSCLSGDKWMRGDPI
jgi:uncharacterized protein YqgV (UPF0045/DUF77 family)